MLRLPKFTLERPGTVAEAVALLADSTREARIVAGGTDILPNMKHGLFEPDVLVSLEDIAELRAVERDADGWLSIGAMVSLAQVADDERVAQHAPALAQAVGLISGPQLRTMGTLGGNVMLDTRCQWYNQTYFWRKALGFCLKKDGTVCHVVAGGRKCVAAASNDSGPALMTLSAVLDVEGPDGRRVLPIDDLWLADGIFNKKLEPAEIVTRVRIPPQPAGHRGAYGKLRSRGSIDFPLLGVAVRLDVDDGGTVQDADLVAVALAARPVRVRDARGLLTGTRPGEASFREAVDAVADAAYRRLTPLENVPGDAEYRAEMVPVYVRRTLLAAAERAGPVHHV